MIIQIRGTSGSGKTTVMRKVMEALAPLHPRHQQGRKLPLYYSRTIIVNDEWEGRVAVLGHYESPCGGCDNVGSAAKVFDLASQLGGSGGHTHILCEGLLLSEDTKWSLQMPDLRVVFLTTGLEECLSRVEGRRKAAGNDKPLNPKNTTNRTRTIERARVKLMDQGVKCRRASSTQAPRIILNWLGFTLAQE